MIEENYIKSQRFLRQISLHDLLNIIEDKDEPWVNHLRARYVLKMRVHDLDELDGLGWTELDKEDQDRIKSLDI
jgi:hypothetical protein